MAAIADIISDSRPLNRCFMALCSSMKAPDSTYRFSRLSQIAMLILVIPHSNAEEERIFSIVQKNKTTFYPNLDLKGRLSSILANSQPADAVLKKNH